MTMQRAGSDRATLDGAPWRPGVRSPLVGRYNRGLVLEAIRLQPGASRVEVASTTGLTTAAVSNIVRSLLDEGLVVEQGVAESRGGKPRVRLQVRERYRYAAGIHIRPHSVSVALSDLDGTVVGQTTVRLGRRSTGPETVLDRAATIVQQLQSDEGVDDEAMLGVGVACPGPIDAANRTVLEAPNLPSWRDVPVAALLEERCGGRVTVENNANAAAMGDKWLGVARDLPTFLYVYLGIGVGGAVFVDHQLYRGATGNAGAIGHISVDPDGDHCRCGNRGCLETVSSEGAMVARVKKVEPGVQERLGLRFTMASLDSDHELILKAAAGGDRRLRSAITPSLEQLGIAVASLVNVLDVGHVVVGGPAVVGAPDLYLTAIRGAISTRPIARRVQHVGVVHSSLGGLAAVVGAASLIFHETYAPSLLRT